MTNNTTANDNLFLVTVWLTVRHFVTLSHRRVLVGMEATMSYIGSLDEKSRAEVRVITHEELFADYNELVRHARTAGLVRNGFAHDRSNSYLVPAGKEAAMSDYMALSVACKSLMAACSVRGKRAELESIHDRARAMSELFVDLSASS